MYPLFFRVFSKPTVVSLTLKMGVDVLIGQYPEDKPEAGIVSWTYLKTPKRKLRWTRGTINAFNAS